MSWIVVPEKVAGQQAVTSSSSGAPFSGEALAAVVAERVQNCIRQGKYREGDIRYVRDVNFSPVKSRLEVSSEMLERMRRLCQLWEVDLTPPQHISSHRKLVGPFIVAAKKCLFPVLRIFLKDTLRRQRDFNAQVITTLAELMSQSSNVSSNIDRRQK